MEPKIAVLWDSEVDEEPENPFSRRDIDVSYRYFTRIFDERNAEFYVANFSRFSDGKLEKCFRFNGTKWVEKENIEIDAVFDKFRLDDETEQVKNEIEEAFPVINQIELQRICRDKLMSYELFPDHVPETRKASEENAREFLEKDGKAVVKPRSDYGGKGVKVIDSMGEFENGEDMLVQRFVDASKGVEELGVEGVHDVRVIVLNGSPEGAFVRTPDSGLISNTSRGGEISSLELEKVPEEGLEIVEDVIEEFERFSPAMYSVDLIFDPEGNPHILELNDKPAITFDGESDDVQEVKKELMKKLADALVDMAD